MGNHHLYSDSVGVGVVIVGATITAPHRGRFVNYQLSLAHFPTLRERLLKLAVWVERSVRRIVLHLPRSAPWGTTWHRVAVAVGAVPG